MTAFSSKLYSTMGNSNSTPEPAPSTEKRRSSLFHTTEDDLGRLARIKKAEDARKEAIAANTHDNIKENQQLLKKLFKRLDPTVSRANTDVQGEVQISLKYDLNNSRLLINVIKCRDLGLNSISGKTAQPFVAISLYPDLDDVGVKQTQQSNKPQNPVYNEKFAFSLEEVALNDTRLIVKVIDLDLVSNDMEFLGEAVISMADFHFRESPVHTAWYSLGPETDLTISGDLDIGFEYTLPQTLAVTVKAATNLKMNYQRKPPNPMVKVGIPGIEQISVTQMRSGMTNPNWDELFTFEVPHEELSMRYVVFTVLDHGTDDDSLLGHVVVDLENFDIEQGYHGTFPLSDMSHSDRLRNKWFQTTQVQEFKEALWAHSVFQYPNVLFKNHTGKKVIRLTCQTTGGAKAKLRVNNGIPVI